MNTEQKEISAAFELVRLVWESHNTGSLILLNPLLQRALCLAIDAQLKFDKNDFSDLYTRYSGEYWLGANANGKGYGERFYSSACEERNTSAAQSYEAFCGFSPFISQKGNRLHERSELRRMNRRYRVTGFNFEEKKVNLVSYELSDVHRTGKKQLHSYDNKAWNAIRKEFTEV